MNVIEFIVEARCWKVKYERLVIFFTIRNSPLFKSLFENGIQAMNPFTKVKGL